MPPAKSVYRILSQECKEMCLPQNREFLQATLESMGNSILTLTNGKSLMRRLPKNPRLQLKKAFREGSAADMQVLFSMLPGLFRYTRAAKLVESHLAGADSAVARPKRRGGKLGRGVGLGRAGAGGLTPQHSLDGAEVQTGALLISKLFYSAEELQYRDVDAIVAEGVETYAAVLRAEVERRLREKQAREDIAAINLASYQRAQESSSGSPKRSNFPQLTPPASLLERRRRLLLQVINALNTVILEREAVRPVGEDYEHLMDRVFQPEFAYYRGMPITYAAVWGAVLNSLHCSVQAVGVAFPRNFLSRLVVRHDGEWSEANADQVKGKGPPAGGDKSSSAGDEALSLIDVLFGSGTAPAYTPATRRRRRKSSAALNAALLLDAEQHEQRLALEAGVAPDLAQAQAQAQALGELEEVGLRQLEGEWVGFYGSGLQEVRVFFNTQTRCLEALKVDGDECVPAGEVTWSLDVSGVARGGAVLKVGAQYPVAVQVAQQGFSNARFTAYTLKLNALPSEIFQPRSGGVVGEPYYEMQLEPVLDSASGSASSRTVSYTASGQPAISVTQAGEGRSSSRGGGEMLSVRGADTPADAMTGVATQNPSIETSGPPLGSISFCRTRDLDRCLLDISDRGVVPLTPVTYLAVMKRFGYGVDFLPTVLQPASAPMVASRMAGNLARSSMRNGGPVEEVLDDSSYWTAVRRLFDQRVKNRHPAS
ncbi:hypothetical protein B484DRAFT_431389 [Ochromonadaceae sp. CCMP2298]|nr:hypothetical protein B484DRAFT_431389 [Ochromonadaceae sp. CCMP2298]